MRDYLSGRRSYFQMVLEDFRYAEQYEAAPERVEEAKP